MLKYVLEEGEKKRAMLGNYSDKVDQSVGIASLVAFLMLGLIASF